MYFKLQHMQEVLTQQITVHMQTVFSLLKTIFQRSLCSGELKTYSTNIESSSRQSSCQKQSFQNRNAAISKETFQKLTKATKMFHKWWFYFYSEWFSCDLNKKIEFNPLFDPCCWRQYLILFKFLMKSWIKTAQIKNI